MERKRGQITVFIILGLLMVIFLIFIISLNNKEVEIAGEKLVKQETFVAESVEFLITNCLKQVSYEVVRNLSFNGGYLNKSQFGGDDFVLYENHSYFFHTIFNSATGKMSRGVTRNFMESELNSYIADNLYSCLDFDVYEEHGYEVIGSVPVVDSHIGVNEVVVDLDFPVQFIIGDVTHTFDKTNAVVHSELGFMYDLAVAIVNREIEFGFFDQDGWMRYNGDTKIYKQKPYPDTVYKILKVNRQENDEWEFNFGVKGFDKVEFVNEPENIPSTILSDFLYYSKDKNCYLNPVLTAKEECNKPFVECDIKPIGEYTEDLCKGTTDIMGNASKNVTMIDRYKSYCNEDGSCDDCMGLKHGESRCVYDGIAGQGWDYVGSRHFKQTCINGELIFIGCADYREELCTEDNVSMEAVCRVNRWQDCIAQTTESSCLDMTKRDCAWSPELSNESLAVFRIARTNHVCHPQVPPGFKHWTSQVNDVCMQASESRECDGWECPTVLNEKISLNCGFQGDCGIGRNINDELTKSGYIMINDIRTLREGIAYMPKGYINSQSYRLNLSLYEFGQSTLTSDLYDYPEGETDYILNELQEFLDEAATWNKCTFCKCSPGPRPSCVYDVLTTFGFFCNVWQAPTYSADCSVCENQPGKPCTEYRCKSIGQNCVYEEVDGFGRCSDVSSGDVVGPWITYEGAETLDGDIKVFKQLDPNFGVEDNYWLCANNYCADDMTGIDGLEPYSQISFTVNLSEPAKCKAFPLHSMEYDEIPSIIPTYGSEEFAMNYTFTGKALNYDMLVEQMDFLTDYSGMILDFSPSYIDGLVISVLDGMYGFASLYGASLLDDIEAARDNYFYNISPRLHDYLDPLEDALGKFLASTGSNRMTYFIKCVDRAGNYQVNNFTFTYAIGQDTLPAVLEFSNPVNETHVDEFPFNLTLWFNEPVLCKFGPYDVDYSDMGYEMDCPKDLLHLRIEGYKCNAEINFTPYNNEVFVACLDQPNLMHKYKVELERYDGVLANRTEMFGMIKLNHSEDEIFVEDMLVFDFNETPSFLFNDSVNLKLQHRHPMYCRFSEMDLDFDSMTLPYMTCLDRNCTYNFDSLPLFVEKDYYISCLRAGVSAPNEGNYVVRFT